jgi:uncharacterized protein (DUF2345 family)
MPTPSNRSNDRSSPKGNLEQNYTAIRYGNDHGSINFGHIHKPADCTSDVIIQASDGRHSIVLDKNGPRKGCTQITAPGRISIQSGEDKVEAEDTLFIHAFNGNIDIVASNGKIRMQATDIEMVAVGSDGTKGNINITASENLNLKAEKMYLNAQSLCKLASTGIVEMTASSCLKMYSSVIRGVSDGVTYKDSKVGGKAYFAKETLLA